MMERWMDQAAPDAVNLDYMFGLWLERQFNFHQRLGIDYRILHGYAKEFCIRHGI